MGKVKKSIQAVDALRKIRNDVFHGKIREDQINEKQLDAGIKGGLKIVNFLKRSGKLL